MKIKLYNPDMKEKYLRERFDNEDSRNTVRYVFKSIELIEDVLQKDLYNFSLPEIGTAIKNAKPHSVSVAKTYGRHISNYVSWAINPMGLRESNIHPMKGVEDTFYNDLIDKTKKVHYSLDEFISLLESLPNAQDQALLALLWEGLSLEEVSHIHYNDVKWNSNEVILRKRDGEIIKVNNRFMRYIKNAYSDTIYRNYITEEGEYKERDLMPSDFIIKNAFSRRGKAGVPVNNSVFYTRLKNIKDNFDLEHLTPNAIKQSGMIFLAAELYKEHGELEYKQFEVIGDKYRSSTVTANGSTYYNTTLMKEIISESKLKELYDIDIKF